MVRVEVFLLPHRGGALQLCSPESSMIHKPENDAAWHREDYKTTSVSGCDEYEIQQMPASFFTLTPGCKKQVGGVCQQSAGNTVVKVG